MSKSSAETMLDAIAAEVRQELKQEAAELTEIFEGRASEVEAIRKLTNPHFLANYISPDGMDDDDDFRPY
jgi:hypothetical protein